MDFLSHACDLGHAGEVFCEAAHIAGHFFPAADGTLSGAPELMVWRRAGREGSHGPSACLLANRTGPDGLAIDPDRGHGEAFSSRIARPPDRSFRTRGAARPLVPTSRRPFRISRQAGRRQERSKTFRAY